MGRVARLMSGMTSRTRTLLQFGSQVGLSSPCIFEHSTEPSIGWRHGDDILFAGDEKICRTKSLTS